MKINKCICSIPMFLIFLLIIIFPPVGVYFLVVKKQNSKKGIYSWHRRLIILELLAISIIVIDSISEIREIIYLYDSGMSLDMINFIPEHFWLYIWGSIECVSIFIGCKKLQKMLIKLKIYAGYVNVDNKTSINKLAKKVNVSPCAVKSDLFLLQKEGYLCSFEIDEKSNKIIYKDNNLDNVEEEKASKKKKTIGIKCDKCGAINKIHEFECIECDFCGNKIIGNGDNN